MKFTTPKIVEVEYKGTHLFAAQSFVDRHPEIINHVFVVPDREYEGAHFDKYCEAVIDSFVQDNEPEQCSEATQNSDWTSLFSLPIIGIKHAKQDEVDFYFSNGDNVRFSAYHTCIYDPCIGSEYPVKIEVEVMKGGQNDTH